MIEKEFVPYQEALRLEELGFDEPCFTVYEKNHFTLWSGTYQNNMDWKDIISAPTYSQVFRWFREKCNLTSCVRTYFNVNFFYEIYVNVNHEITSDSYKTYEETELECLKKLIEIVKLK